jgi:EKC/KEOPS complex subunit CGI121/TPRKB
LLNGESAYAFIDAEILVDSIQLFLAIHKALDAMDNQKLVTKNVISEIIYCLSPNTNVSHF